MQRALVPLQRQGVVTALIDDLLGNRALTVERVGGHDGTLQRQHLQQLRHRGNLVRLGVCGDLSQHQTLLAAPGTDHMQSGLTTGAIEGAAQSLPVDGDNAWLSLGKRCDEPLEGSAELSGVEQAEQSAERIVAGQAVLELQEAPQERLLRNRKCRHVRRTLTAAQDRAQGDDQQLVEVVQAGIAGPRVLQSLKAGDKLVQHGLPRRLRLARVESIRSESGKRCFVCKGNSKCDSPGRTRVID
jgi:hypothetical protein